MSQLNVLLFFTPVWIIANDTTRGQYRNALCNLGKIITAPRKKGRVVASPQLYQKTLSTTSTMNTSKSLHKIAPSDFHYRRTICGLGKPPLLLRELVFEEADQIPDRGTRLAQDLVAGDRL